MTTTATGKARSLAVYLRQIHSNTYRPRVRRRANQIAEANGFTNKPGQRVTSSANARTREWLHDAIFEIENEIESSGEGNPDHPAIANLRAVRNQVADDLGWNESPICP